ncbi:2-hydroxyacid dehydrogenase [Marinicella sp. W31]|uniref:2-hydroxyacid dehydrogenase n=1 Tax=Marinicella sp. W31 TaxID=3023713 RepID=UPI003757C566
MGIALIVTDRDSTELAKALAEHLPETSIQVWPDLPEPDAVHLAILWKQPPEILQDMPHLKAVSSLGAGVDFIEDDVSVPKHLPIHKIVTPRLQQEMAQYVAAYILQHYRQVELYKDQQKISQWHVHELPMQPKVGLLGLGEIAEYVADVLSRLGFSVQAYTKSSRHDTIKTHHGMEGLHRVLTDSDYVVNLLPLNVETRDILNAKHLAWCQRQPLLINAGRGGHVVEQDLIEAIDSGVISSAVLDVFVEEPLPRDHAFWKHSKITISPHNAARSDTCETAAVITQLYRSLMSTNR